MSTITDRDRRVRARRVKALLRAHADTTQVTVRSTLSRLVADGQASAVKIWWIDNAVSFTGTVAAVRAVAALPEIALVTLDAVDIRPLTGPVGAPPGAPAGNIGATGAPTLWSRGITGASVVVADLDTGVDGTQPDLAGSWRGGTSSWFDPYGQHTTPTDVNGHGTWTTSVMVGRDGSGQAVGMAPDAQWIAARVFDDSGRATLSGVHAAFQWVLDPSNQPQTPNPPQVLNASWSSASSACSTEFQPDLAALRAVGIVPVFAAGNSGPAANSGTSPATLPEALAVGSVDGSDTVSFSSSRGPANCAGRTHFPDLVAPGVDIPVDDLYGGSWTVSGSSVAAPHVAGALALLLSAHPATTAADQQAALVAGARDLGEAGDDDSYGFGSLDVVAAEAAMPPPAPLGPVTSSVGVTPNPAGASAVPTVTATLTASSGGAQPVSARAGVDGGATISLAVSTANGVTTATGALADHDGRRQPHRGRLRRRRSGYLGAGRLGDVRHRPHRPRTLRAPGHSIADRRRAERDRHRHRHRRRDRRPNGRSVVRRRPRRRAGHGDDRHHRDGQLVSEGSPAHGRGERRHAHRVDPQRGRGRQRQH